MYFDRSFLEKPSRELCHGYRYIAMSRFRHNQHFSLTILAIYLLAVLGVGVGHRHGLSICENSAEIQWQSVGDCDGTSQDEQCLACLLASAHWLTTANINAKPCSDIGSILQPLDNQHRPSFRLRASSRAPPSHL